MVVELRGNRQQSLERAVVHVGLVVIEAPKGFEADQFVQQLVHRLGDPAEIVDPDDIDGNARPDTAIWRSPLHAGLRGWRDTVVRRFEEGKATVLVLPAGVSGDVLIEEPVPTLLIDGAALRMTVPDVIEMGRTACGAGVVVAPVAELLVQLSDGWPAWLHACCTAITDQQIGLEQLVSRVGMPPFRRRIVARSMHAFDLGDRYRMAQLAHFEHFSDRAAIAVGGLEFAETVLPHAPGLYRTRSGQLRFVDPVRLELMAELPLDPAAAETLAPVLVADGQLLGACHALLDAGLHEQACRLIEDLPGRVIDICDQRELLGVLRVLADHIPDHPGLALKQARIHANLAEIAASAESCEAAIAASTRDDPVRLEASVELLLYRHRTIGQEEAADALADLRREVGVSGPLPTRLREIEAQILGQSKDNHVVQAAADRFVEVASEWEFQQEHLRAAKTLRGLCVGPLWHLGHYSEAQERLDRAARLAINQTFDFGVTMTTKSLFDARCGDWDTFQRSLDQARMIVAESGIRWLESYLALGSAYKAAADRSLAAVRASVRSARDLLGPLLNTDTGVLFTAESAVLLAEVGDHTEARRMLDSVAHRFEQNEMEFRFADLVLLARAGDREGAWLAWSGLDREDLVPNDRRWRIELELARADHLAGVPQKVDVESIAGLADRLGLAGVARQLAPELLDGGQQLLPIRVEILGGFRVSGSAGVFDVPKGHARELIKILAVEGGSAPVETVVAHLWPDVEFKLGLRRLKNVVVKVRDLLGPEAICREATVVRFADHITVDVNDFEAMRLASLAKRSADPIGSRDAAIIAIDVYEGPLLVDDLFVDRINERRFQLQRSATELLEYVDREHRPNAAWFAAASRRVDAG